MLLFITFKFYVGLKMEQKYKDQIAKEFVLCVDNTIKRIKNDEPTFRPFHSALLSDDVLTWSRFERSFSTSFGQKTIETIAEIAAISNGALGVCRQKETTVCLDKAILDAINEHESSIRSGNNQYLKWNQIVSHINKVTPVGKKVPIRIISDLWWKDSAGKENYLSIKTVKPNIDQTVVAKLDCLKLYFDDKKRKVFFGLPYNPYGDDRKLYDHKPVLKVFDFHSDEVVLLGRDLWDTLGGTGCYDTIIEIAKTVGKDTIGKIEKL